MVICCFLLLPSISIAQDNVVLQLKWKHGFQFAGYYAAKEQGYYNDVGLNVELRAATPGINYVDEIIKGRAQYGVGNSALLLERQKGKPLVVLSVVFQHSPSIFITKGNGQVTSLKDLVGKRVMIQPNSLELFAYLKKAGVSRQQIQIIDHSYNLNSLIQGDVDALSAYSSNEPYTLNQKGFSFKEFTPREAGLDFYGDNLFTTEDEINSHPRRVEDFRIASMKGWLYAMAHKAEIIELILNKYGQDLPRKKLQFEAQAMDNLLVNDLIEIGHMNPERWQRIVAAYKTLDQIQDDNILDGFIYKPHKGFQEVIKANQSVLIKSLSAVLLLIAFLIYHNHQLRLFNRKLKSLAETDPLTGIYNRKRLDEVLERETERFLRYKHPFSVIMIDLDKFKNVNDRYGHHVGDEVLIQIVAILSTRVRITDTLGRWGGEEFMLICPEIETEATMHLAEGLCRAINEPIFATVGHQTASFGVAACQQGDKTNDVVKRADDALFVAKQRGRNQVVASPY